MSNKNEDLREQFAEARAIYFAMLNGAITYEKATLLTTPILSKINIAIGLMSMQYKVTPQFIKFQDLGVNL